MCALKDLKVQLRAPQSAFWNVGPRQHFRLTWALEFREFLAYFVHAGKGRQDAVNERRLCRAAQPLHEELRPEGLAVRHCIAAYSNR